MSETPPAYPWLKGSHPGYEAVVIEVHICRDTEGRVYSNHALQDDVDHRTSLAWPSGGQEQAAFALLTEAVRREAVLQVLMLASQDESLVSRLPSMPDEERKKLLSEMAQRLQTQVSSTASRLALEAAAEALNFLSS